MKITALETIQLGEFPNLVWVRVRTDEGLVGLGETFFGASSVAAYIHRIAAPYLLGELSLCPCSERPGCRQLGPAAGPRLRPL